MQTLRNPSSGAFPKKMLKKRFEEILQVCPQIKKEERGGGGDFLLF